MICKLQPYYKKEFIFCGQRANIKTGIYFFSKYMYSSCLIFKNVVPQRYMESIDEIRKMLSFLHYSEVIMGAIASQITSFALFTYWFIQAQIRENIKAPPHWSLCGEFTSDRWMFPFDDVTMNSGLYTAWSHFLEAPGFRLQPFLEISHGWSWRQKLSYASVTSNYRLCTIPHHCLCFWSVSAAGPWWRHQMETFSALLGFCAGNSPVTSEFPAQRPDTRSFNVFFHLHP